MDDEVVSIRVVSPQPPAPERSSVEDRVIIKRFLARKVCGSLAVGAFSSWKTDTTALQMALLRLESILVYNLLDRGCRVDSSMTQADAIRDSVGWHVAVYSKALLVIPEPHAISSAEYEACLKEMIRFRMSRYGVKTPKTAGNKDAIVPSSLRNAAIAVCISHKIFLKSCFTSEKKSGGPIDLHDLSVDEVDCVDLADAIKAAWAYIDDVANTQVIMPPAGEVISNTDICVATRGVLVNFTPPVVEAIQPGAHVDGNTFLTAGKPVRGDMFRLCCRCIMVTSSVCATNKEPIGINHRNVWLNLKHFNFLDHIFADKLSPHLYSVGDEFDENAFLRVIDQLFPDIYV